MRPIQTNATVRIEPTTMDDHPLFKERIAVYKSSRGPARTLRASRGLHRGDATLDLQAWAVAVVRAGEQQCEPERRRAWGVPVVIDPAHTGWSDVDEETATFRFGSGPGAEWLVHGADLLDGLDVDRQVNVHTADGTPAPASVLVHHDDGGEVLRRRPLSGDDDIDPDYVLSARPRPRNSRRVFVAVRAPKGTFVLAPRKRRTS